MAYFCNLIVFCRNAIVHLKSQKKLYEECDRSSRSQKNLTKVFDKEIFEYKYIIWRDRNTSFLKMCGRYDRARSLDNFNHQKVIMCGYWYEFSNWVLERLSFNGHTWAISYLHSPITTCDYKLDRIQSNFVKMKQKPEGYNITFDKLEFARGWLS